MGAGPSQAAELPTIPYHRDLYWWDFATAAAAAARARAACASPDGRFTTLTRRQFWEAFTDYDCVVAGAFLCLPPAVFDLLADAKPARWPAAGGAGGTGGPRSRRGAAARGRATASASVGSERDAGGDSSDDGGKASDECVDGMLVLIAVLVAGQATLEEAMVVAVRAYLGLNPMTVVEKVEAQLAAEERAAKGEDVAVDEDPLLLSETEVPEDVVFRLLFDTTRVLLRLSVLDRREQPEGVHSLEEEEALRGKRVDVRQNCMVLVDHIFRELEHAAGSVVLSPKSAGSHSRRHSRKRGSVLSTTTGERAVMLDDLVDWARMSAPVQAAFGPLKDAKRLIMRVEKRTVGRMSDGTIARGGARGGAGGSKADERVSMMNASFVAAKNVLDQLSSGESRFSIRELRGLRPMFVKAAGGEGKELNRDQFARLMATQFPQLAGSDGGSAVTLLFDSFDTDGSNSIDFREFAIGVSKRMPGTLAEKLSIVFDAFADPETKTVLIRDLLDLIRTGNLEMAEVANFTEEIVAGLDTGAGEIPEEQFKDVLREQPILRDCFSKATHTRGMDTIKLMYSTASSENKLSFGDLLRTFTKHMESGWGERATMNLTAFRKFCMEELGAKQGIMFAINALYDLLASGQESATAAHDGLPYSDLIHGLAQLLDVDDEDDRMDLFFKIYDTDGNGSLDMDEIRQLVLSSQDAANKSVRASIRFLKEMERRKGPEVEPDAFIAVVRGNEQLSHCFKVLLGIDKEEDAEARRGKSLRRRVLQPNKLQSEATGSGETMMGVGAKAAIKALRTQSLNTASSLLSSLQSVSKKTLPGNVSPSAGRQSSDGKTTEGGDSDITAEGGGGKHAEDEGSSRTLAPPIGVKTKKSQAEREKEDVRKQILRSTSASAARMAAKEYGSMLNQKLGTSLRAMRRDFREQRQTSKVLLNEMGKHREMLESVKSAPASSVSSGYSSDSPQAPTTSLTKKRSRKRVLSIETGGAASVVSKPSPLRQSVMTSKFIASTKSRLKSSKMLGSSRPGSAGGSAEIASQLRLGRRQRSFRRGHHATDQFVGHSDIELSDHEPEVAGSVATTGSRHSRGPGAGSLLRSSFAGSPESPTSLRSISPKSGERRSLFFGEPPGKAVLSGTKSASSLLGASSDPATHEGRSTSPTAARGGRSGSPTLQPIPRPTRVSVSRLEQAISADDTKALEREVAYRTSPPKERSLVPLTGSASRPVSPIVSPTARRKK